jgi:hypothetical protein
MQLAVHGFGYIPNRVNGFVYFFMALRRDPINIGRWVKHYLSQDIMCWLRDYLVMEERGIGIA